MARAAPFGFDVGSEGYLTPNDDYETELVLTDELDKGVSKSQLPPEDRCFAHDNHENL